MVLIRNSCFLVLYRSRVAGQSSDFFVRKNPFSLLRSENRQLADSLWPLQETSLTQRTSLTENR